MSGWAQVRGKIRNAGRFRVRYRPGIVLLLSVLARSKGRSCRRCLYGVRWYDRATFTARAPPVVPWAWSAPDAGQPGARGQQLAAAAPDRGLVALPGGPPVWGSGCFATRAAAPVSSPAVETLGFLGFLRRGAGPLRCFGSGRWAAAVLAWSLRALRMQGRHLHGRACRGRAVGAAGLPSGGPGHVRGNLTISYHSDRPVGRCGRCWPGRRAAVPGRSRSGAGQVESPDP